MSQSGSMGANTQTKLIKSRVKMKIWEAWRRWVVENIERMYEIKRVRKRQIKRWREDLLQSGERQKKRVRRRNKPGSRMKTERFLLNQNDVRKQFWWIGFFAVCLFIPPLYQMRRLWDCNWFNFGDNCREWCISHQSPNTFWSPKNSICYSDTWRVSLLGRRWDCDVMSFSMRRHVNNCPKAKKKKKKKKKK